MVTDIEVGASAHHDRHLAFASGGEVRVRDSVVRAVLFHTRPTDVSRYGFDLRRLVPGLDRNATRQQLVEALGTPLPGRATPTSTTHAVGGGFVKLFFDKGVGPHEPGHLRVVQLTPHDTFAGLDPADDRCPGCAGMLVRDRSGTVDVDATVPALLSGVAAGHLRQQPGSPARIERELQRPQKIASDGNSWVLYAKGEHLFLNARCWYSAVDSSKLVRLNEAEARAYHSRGDAYLSQLQQEINSTFGGHRDDIWRARDLSRSGLSDEEAIEAHLAADDPPGDADTS